MPPSMNPAFLSSSIREAQNLAEIQPSSGSRIQPLQHQMHSEAGHQSFQRISPSDLRVLRDKFPQLSEFSEEFPPVQNARRTPKNRVNLCAE